MKHLIAAFRKMLARNASAQAQIDTATDRVQVAIDKVNAYIDSDED